MIKVLYLSYDGLTDPLGQSQVIPYLQGLARQGYQFTIISFEKPERFKESKDQLQTLLGNSGIRWVPLTYHRKPPVLSTLYDVYALRKKAYELHRKENFSIVHCRSYITALVGTAMKRTFGVKFIFDMRGFWADERVEGGLWNIQNPVYKIIYQYFKRKEKQLLSTADYTVTLTHRAKDIIHQWADIKDQPIPIRVIPCCVDTELFDPKKVDEQAKAMLRKRLGIPTNAFVLSYLGSLGTWYMVEEMLRFYKKFQRSYANTYFLFVTKDSPQEIEQISEKLTIEYSKIIITSASRNEVPLYLSLSHWSIFFIKPVFSKQASSATKMGEIMSMGIPFVTNPGIGDSDTLIAQNKIGILTSLGAYHETVNAIRNLSKIPTEKIRATAIEHYSLQKGVISYSRVYQKII